MTKFLKFLTEALLKKRAAVQIEVMIAVSEARVKEFINAAALALKKGLMIAIADY